MREGSLNIGFNNRNDFIEFVVHRSGCEVIGQNHQGWIANGNFELANWFEG
jgi:hypothetical protein